MSAVHVVPLHDLVEHDVPGGIDGIHGAPHQWLSISTDPDADGSDTACICQPSVETVLNPDGPDGWMFVHHSLDRREDRECRAPAPATPTSEEGGMSDDHDRI